MENCYFITKNGGKVDLQRVATTLLNTLKISTIGIIGKAHISQNYAFAGPNTSFFYESEERPGRLNDDFTPKV